MNKQELQAQIVGNTRLMFKLADAASKIPNSQIRDDLIRKHDGILQRLSDLQCDLERLDRNACYFGLTDRCPGLVCCECLAGEQYGW